MLILPFVNNTDEKERVFYITKPNRKLKHSIPLPPTHPHTHTTHTHILGIHIATQTHTHTHSLVGLIFDNFDKESKTRKLGKYT